MRIDCPLCSSPHRIDEQDVPAWGARYRCTSCESEFGAIQSDSGIAPGSSDDVGLSPEHAALVDRFCNLINDSQQIVDTDPESALLGFEKAKELFPGREIRWMPEWLAYISEAAALAKARKLEMKAQVVDENAQAVEWERQQQELLQMAMQAAASAAEEEEERRAKRSAAAKERRQKADELKERLDQERVEEQKAREEAEQKAKEEAEQKAKEEAEPPPSEAAEPVPLTAEDEGKVKSLVREGEGAAKAGDNEKGAELLRAAVAILRRGKAKPLFRVMERLLRLVPDDLELLNESAGLMVELGESRKATDRYELVLRKKPGNLVALEALDALYAELGEKKARIRVLTLLCEAHEDAGNHVEWDQTQRLLKDAMAENRS